MVVRQHAAVDRRSAQAVRVLGAHPVIYGFREEILAAGDARFEIDDAGVRPHAVQLVEGRAPDIRGPDGPWNRAIRLLRKAHIVHCRACVVLVQRGVAWMRQHLIDAPAGHDISA